MEQGGREVQWREKDGREQEGWQVTGAGGRGGVEKEGCKGMGLKGVERGQKGRRCVRRGEGVKGGKGRGEQISLYRSCHYLWVYIHE